MHTAIHQDRLAFHTLENTSLLVFWVLPCGGLSYVNPAARSELGYSREEIERLRASDILADYTPDQRKSLRSVLLTEEKGWIRAALRRKDGSIFSVLSQNSFLEIDGLLINCAVSRNMTGVDIRDAPAEEEPNRGGPRSTLFPGAYRMADEIGIVGSSRRLQNVLRIARQIADNDTSVLIRGETGVGKEGLARYVFSCSSRNGEAFVQVNCANFSGEDIQSQLFGHLRGAYTGAHSNRKGAFETADKGTIFLDEVGELPKNTQSKLLRVLQNGSYTRMGEDRERRVNVRVIAATNRKLETMIADGTFREDLYFRLNVLQLQLPPLRERKADIPELVDHKISELNKITGRRMGRPSPEDIRLLSRQTWPGNIRELFNVIERTYHLERSDRLTIRPELFYQPRPLNEELTTDYFPTMRELQAQHIRRAMQRSFYKMSGPGGAAELLGMNPGTLYAAMKRLGVEKPRRER